MNTIYAPQRPYSEILTGSATTFFAVLRSTTIKALALALFLSASAATEAAIYMDFGDFPGEATKEPHVDWINVLAVSLGDYRPETFFGTREWADSTLQDIVVTKESDKSTPKLTESILTGKVHDKVVIDLAVSTPVGPEPSYFQIEMEKVRLTSQSFSDNGGAAPATETITLNPEKIKWVYTEIVDSEEKGKIEFAWDVIGGRPASTSGLPGDYNNDGIVDGVDSLVLQRRFGAPVEALENRADAGVIDRGLYDIWSANFGRGLTVAPRLNLAAVPEPGACALIGIGITLLLPGGQRRLRRADRH